MYAHVPDSIPWALGAIVILAGVAFPILYMLARSTGSGAAYGRRD